MFSFICIDQEMLIHGTVSAVLFVAHMQEEIRIPWMLSFPLAGAGELLPVNLQQMILCISTFHLFPVTTWAVKNKELKI